MINVKYFILIVLFLFSKSVASQNQIFASGLFYQKNANNPSYAGLEKQWKINSVFKTPLINEQEGLSKEYLVSAYGNIAENAGAGITFTSQSIGLLRQNLLSLNYAYGFKLNNTSNLRLGFAAGFQNRLLLNSTSNIVGDINDPAVISYNSNPSSFFSSFGLTYFSNKLEIQAALPNLTSSLSNSNFKSVNFSIAQLGITYNILKASSEQRGLINSKIFAGLNQFKETGSVFFGGLMFSKNNLFDASLIYNSTGIITTGFALPVEKIMLLNINYSFGGVYSKNIYGGGGTLEVCINYNFKN